MVLEVPGSCAWDGTWTPVHTKQLPYDEPMISILTQVMLIQRLPMGNMPRAPSVLHKETFIPTRNAFILMKGKEVTWLEKHPHMEKMMDEVITPFSRERRKSSWERELGKNIPWPWGISAHLRIHFLILNEISVRDFRHPATVSHLTLPCNTEPSLTFLATPVINSFPVFVSILYSVQQRTILVPGNTSTVRKVTSSAGLFSGPSSIIETSIKNVPF